MSPGVTKVALKNPVGMGAAPNNPSLPPDSHLHFTFPQSCVADARAWLTEQLG